MKHHFEIQSLKLEIAESKANYEKSFGEFDFSLNYNFSYNQQDTPVSSSLDTEGNTSSVLTKTTSQSLSLSKFFKSGTQITLPYNLNIIDSESTYRTIRKSYEPTFSINLKQPLLRPFFSGYYQKKLQKALIKYQSDQSKKDYQASEKLYTAIEKTFQYLEAKKSYSIREKGYLTAKKNLDFVKAKRKVGSASKLDLLDARTNNSKSYQRFLEQEILVHKLKNELKSMIDKDIEEELSLSEEGLIASDFSCKCDPSNMLKVAIENRGDYLAQKLNLDLKTIQEKFARADRLPKVDFNLDYSSRAIKATTSEANDELAALKFPTYKAAVTVSYNLLQYAEAGAEKASILKTKQDQIKLDQLYRDLDMEIKVAIKNFQVQKVVVDSLKDSLDAEKIKWDFYTKKFKQGQISAFDYAKFSEDKENSELEYFKGLFKLERDYYKLFLVKGTLFKEFFTQT